MANENLPGAQQSNLSAYGYDYVEAVTQDSVNNMFRHFMDYNMKPHTATLVIMSDGSARDLKHLLNKSNGSDPFAESPTPTDIQNLFSAGFAAACKFTPGVPQVYQRDLLDILSVNVDSGSVFFNMLCSDCVMVQLITARGSDSPSAPWLSTTRQTKRAWIFSSGIDVADSFTSSKQEGHLPYSVQKYIRSHGADLDWIPVLKTKHKHPHMTPLTSIDGSTELDTLADSVVKNSFAKHFPYHYMRAASSSDDLFPPLSCSVARINAWMHGVFPLIDGNGKRITATPGLATFNHLAVIDGKSLPSPQRFAWNWIEPDSFDAADGVVCVNADLFRNYLCPKFLLPAFQKYSVVPRLSGTPYATAFSYQSSQDSQYDIASGKSQVMVFNTTFPGVVDQLAESGYNLIYEGEIKDTTYYTVRYTYNGTVDFIDAHIQIVQDQQVTVNYVNVRGSGVETPDNYPQTSGAGNLVSQKRTDTYGLVFTNGTLSFQQLSPQIESANDNDLASVLASFPSFPSGLISTMQSPPALEGLIDDSAIAESPMTLPCAGQFSISNARFSDNQDLFAYITYLNDDGAPPKYTALASAAPTDGKSRVFLGGLA